MRQRRFDIFSIRGDIHPADVVTTYLPELEGIVRRVNPDGWRHNGGCRDGATKGIVFARRRTASSMCIMYSCLDVHAYGTLGVSRHVMHVVHKGLRNVCLFYRSHARPRSARQLFISCLGVCVSVCVGVHGDFSCSYGVPVRVSLPMRSPSPPAPMGSRY